LHRAFSVFIFNCRGDLLIQQRSREKMLWGGFWSNACCSHPRVGESLENGAARRIVEELGVACGLRFIYRFTYHAAYEDVGSEREVCSVFIGVCDDLPVPSANEISEFRFVGVDDLVREVKEFREGFTPWFLLELDELRVRDILWRTS
jgi:isopentenyl-diphosphate delta-isomerase